MYHNNTHNITCIFNSKKKQLDNRNKWVHVNFNWVPTYIHFVVKSNVDTARQFYLHWDRWFDHWIGLWVDEPCQRVICPSSEECAACRKRWRWLDGSPMPEEWHSLWLSHKPNGRGHCGRLYLGVWADAGCSWPYNFICKKGKTLLIRIKPNLQKSTS